MSTVRRDALLRQGALAFARQQAWLASNRYPTTKIRRITKAQSDAGESGFISHGERDPGRRSDPGAAFPWTLFLAACQAAIGEVPSPVQKEIDVFIVDDPNSSAQWICDAHTRRHSMNFTEVTFLAANGVPWFQEVPETIGPRNILLQQRVIVPAVAP